MSDSSIPKEVSLENRPCPIGCAADDEQILVGHDRLHNLPGDYTVVKCRACGLLRTNPRPTQQTISYYYPDDYGPYVATRIVNDSGTFSRMKKIEAWICHWIFQDKKAPLDMLKRVFRRVGNLVFEDHTTNLPNITKGKFLEIGCASGSFLSRMADRGWEVSGIEYSESAARQARANGYLVHTGPLETASSAPDTYDLVAGWMVLEHLHEPLMALQKLCQWTKVGGWLVFSVPNTSAFEFKLFGKYWYALHLPAHLYHYTPKTIDLLLQRSGWKLEKVFHQRNMANVVGSLGYILGDSSLEFLRKVGVYLQRLPEHGGRLWYFVFPLAYVAGLFGQTGRMTIWARRV